MNNTVILCTAMVCATVFATAMSPLMRSAPDLGANIETWVNDNPAKIISSLTEFHQEQEFADFERENVAMVERIGAEDGRLFDVGHSLEMGNLAGDVTMVLFSDYNCPHCASAHTTVKQVLAQDPDLRLILREYPVLGASSDLAARFAIAVGIEGGREAALDVHDALFAASGQIAEPHLKRITEQMDMDYDVISSLMVSEQVSAMIQDNLDLAGTIGVQGTPNFIFAGGAIVGSVPAENLLAAAAAERAAR